MSDASGTLTMPDGVAMLERAMSYTLGSLRLVTTEQLSRPTPCAEWDLRALLEHMNDSLLALCEAADVGRVYADPLGVDDDPATGLVQSMRDRACQLLGVWVGADSPARVSIGERSLTSRIVAGTGAVEVAVHGWDVARACGSNRRVPTGLAEDLIELSRILVVDADRPARFAPPLPVSRAADASEKLLNFLGRRV
ncbi:TIGR03086 family metal-binding protein [Phytoactinopolyspora mesophila]|uniref:TIGR03086 family protein n=1 Tax=Phytoactinopolyspora mesophila TaxID=2650750 RepID=A0A7K3MB66_9ACTN|nr:TIGR03086 family metal-binding protein [Phytoactinopolyspora mesophila]NDL60565.1 TIGR03086 family protein [Phytoactinopolyspora mesophila]